MRKKEEDEEKKLAKRDHYWDWTWPEEALREMDSMFEDFRPFWRHRMAGPMRAWRGFPSEVKQPPVDIVETSDSIIVTTEVPGAEKENIDFHISEDSIEIKAEMKREEIEEGEDYYRRERGYSSFYRQMALPAEVVADKATAKLNNGVLEVTIPKKAPAEGEKKRKVEVK